VTEATITIAILFLVALLPTVRWIVYIVVFACWLMGSLMALDHLTRGARP
jgi:hypothetical protein